LIKDPVHDFPKRLPASVGAQIAEAISQIADDWRRGTPRWWSNDSADMTTLSPLGHVPQPVGGIHPRPLDEAGVALAHVTVADGGTDHVALAGVGTAIQLTFWRL
jgi:hypothetical protein